MLSQIKETAIYVRDLQRTKAFYADVLGLPLIGERGGRHVFFRVGPSILLCFNAEATRDEVDVPRHFGEGELHLAFEAEAGRYDEIKAKLEEAGVEIEAELSWPRGGRSFYFRDPDRHCLEVVEPGIWGD
ncbi:MAG: VOC family protein [Myxococcales bacterium]|nr:VOC family protein [Myxococcales bacterium]